MSKFAVCDYETLARLMQLLPKEHNKYPQISKLERVVNKMGISSGGVSGSVGSGCNCAQTIRLKRVEQGNIRIETATPENCEHYEDIEPEMRNNYAILTTDNSEHLFESLEDGFTIPYVFLIEEKGFSPKLCSMIVGQIEHSEYGNFQQAIAYVYNENGTAFAGMNIFDPRYGELPGNSVGDIYGIFDEPSENIFHLTGFTDRCGLYRLATAQETEGVIEVSYATYTKIRTNANALQNIVQEQNINDLIKFKSETQEKLQNISATIYIEESNLGITSVEKLDTVPEYYGTKHTVKYVISTSYETLIKDLQTNSMIFVSPDIVTGAYGHEFEYCYFAYSYKYVDANMETVYVFVNRLKQVIYVRITNATNYPSIVIATNTYLLDKDTEPSIIKDRSVLKTVSISHSTSSSTMSLPLHYTINLIAEKLRIKHQSEEIEFIKATTVKKAENEINLQKKILIDTATTTIIEGHYINITGTFDFDTLGNTDYFCLHKKNENRIFFHRVGQLTDESWLFINKSYGKIDARFNYPDAIRIVLYEHVYDPITLSDLELDCGFYSICETKEDLTIDPTTHGVLEHLVGYLNERKNNNASTPSTPNTPSAPPSTPTPPSTSTDTSSGCNCGLKVQQLVSWGDHSFNDENVLSYEDSEAVYYYDDYYVYLKLQGEAGMWFRWTRSDMNNTDYTTDHTFYNKAGQTAVIKGVSWDNTTIQVHVDQDAYYTLSYYTVEAESGIYKLYDSTNDNGNRILEVPVLTQIGLEEQYNKNKQDPNGYDQSIEDRITLSVIGDRFNPDYITAYDDKIEVEDVRRTSIVNGDFLYFGGKYDDRKWWVKTSTTGINTSNAVATYYNAWGNTLTVAFDDTKDSYGYDQYYITVTIKNSNDNYGGISYDGDYSEEVYGCYSVVVDLRPNTQYEVLRIPVLEYEVLKWYFVNNSFNAQTEVPSGSGGTMSNLTLNIGADPLKRFIEFTSVTKHETFCGTYYVFDATENCHDAATSARDYYLRFGFKGKKSYWYVMHDISTNSEEEIYEENGEQKQRYFDKLVYTFQCMSASDWDAPSEVRFIMLQHHFGQYDPAIEVSGVDMSTITIDSLSEDTGFYRVAHDGESVDLLIESTTRNKIVEKFCEYSCTLQNVYLAANINAIANGTHHIGLTKDIVNGMREVDFHNTYGDDRTLRFTTVKKDTWGDLRDHNYVYYTRSTRDYYKKHDLFTDQDVFIDPITVGCIFKITYAAKGKFEYPIPYECIHNCEESGCWCNSCGGDGTKCTGDCECKNKWVPAVGDEILVEYSDRNPRYDYYFYCYEIVKTNRDDAGMVTAYHYKCACMNPNDRYIKNYTSEDYEGVNVWLSHGGKVIDIYEEYVDGTWKFSIPISDFTIVCDGEFYDHDKEEYVVLPRVFLQCVPDAISIYARNWEIDAHYENLVSSRDVYNTETILSWADGDPVVDNTVMMQKIIALQSEKISKLEEEILEIKRSMNQ